MNPDQASEQLRVIRNLMERATIYRAISAPTALVGGVLSVIASVLLSDWSTRRFIVGWLVVLCATLAANTWLIHRKARREGGKIFSPGLRLAIRAASPALLVAAVFTGRFWVETAGVTVPVFVVATLWTLFYGLALLSTATFAPRSLIILGWAFLITSLLAYVVGDYLSSFAKHPATFLMAQTFGLYHLVYAVCTWPRKGLGDPGAMSIE